MSKKLPHLIDLVVGDWSGDGHSQTETVPVYSNLKKRDLEKAYKKGTALVGFDLTRDVCCSYDDNVIDEHRVVRLESLGITRGQYLNEREHPERPGPHQLSPNEFAVLWLRIAQLGDPGLEYKVTDDDSPHINIGGYGLYD